MAGGILETENQTPLGLGDGPGNMRVNGPQGSVTPVLSLLPLSFTLWSFPSPGPQNSPKLASDPLNTVLRPGEPVKPIQTSSSFLL